MTVKTAHQLPTFLAKNRSCSFVFVLYLSWFWSLSCLSLGLRLGRGGLGFDFRLSLGIGLGLGLGLGLGPDLDLGLGLGLGLGRKIQCPFVFQTVVACQNFLFLEQNSIHPPQISKIPSSFLISVFYILRKPTIQRFLCRNNALWASARLCF